MHPGNAPDPGSAPDPRQIRYAPYWRELHTATFLLDQGAAAYEGKRPSSPFSWIEVPILT